jgi:hypothetical protein
MVCRTPWLSQGIISTQKTVNDFFDRATVLRSLSEQLTHTSNGKFAHSDGQQGRKPPLFFIPQRDSFDFFIVCRCDDVSGFDIVEYHRGMWMILNQRPTDVAILFSCNDVC